MTAASGPSLLGFVEAISRTLDLIDDRIRGHHSRVAALSVSVALELELDLPEIETLYLASLLHDAGALTLENRHGIFRFEADELSHAEMGYRLLAGCRQLERPAEVVRHHHARWDLSERSPIPLASRILHLADRVDLLVDGRGLDFRSEALPTIRKHSGSRFAPQVVDALEAVAGRARAGGDTGSRPPTPPQELLGQLHSRRLGRSELDELSGVVSQIIDFRSRFTATHSAGVAAVAQQLAAERDFPPERIDEIRIAGHLHDVGKLAVPGELLEKPGALTPPEMALVRSHAGIGAEVLSAVKGIERVRRWAARHHERIDGNGYPFGYADRQLDAGARILAVADVFTALAEDRPYRRGLGRESLVAELRAMVMAGALDGSLVGQGIARFDAIAELRSEAQDFARKAYGAFYLTEATTTPGAGRGTRYRPTESAPR